MFQFYFFKKSRAKTSTSYEIGLALMFIPFSKNEPPDVSSGSNNILLRYYIRKVHLDFFAIVEGIFGIIFCCKNYLFGLYLASLLPQTSQRSFMATTMAVDSAKKEWIESEVEAIDRLIIDFLSKTSDVLIVPGVTVFCLPPHLGERLSGEVRESWGKKKVEEQGPYVRIEFGLDRKSNYLIVYMMGRTQLERDLSTIPTPPDARRRWKQYQDLGKKNLRQRILAFLLGRRK